MTSSGRATTIQKIIPTSGAPYLPPSGHPGSHASCVDPLLRRAHLAVKAIPNAVYAHEMTQARFAVLRSFTLLAIFDCSSCRSSSRAPQLADLQIRANAIETRLAASATGTHAGVRTEHAPALVRTRLGYTTASSAPTSTVRPRFVSTNYAYLSQRIHITSLPA
jgi:hypothetical protein